MTKNPSSFVYVNLARMAMTLEEFEAELANMASLLEIESTQNSLPLHNAMFQSCNIYANLTPVELLRRNRKFEAYDALRIVILESGAAAAKTVANFSLRYAKTLKI
jgi:hypothetical protein